MAKQTIFESALELGYIDFVQKAKAEQYKEEYGLSDDTVIRETKILSDESIVKLYSDVYGIAKGEVEEVEDMSLMQRLNPKEMRNLFFFPVKKEDKIVIYTALPSNLVYAEDMLREEFEYRDDFLYKVISLKELNA